MTRLIVGPFNRVEGDLEVRLEISGGRVESAWVSSTLYRGFERILLGKNPADALVFTPRICGICSVSQSVAAARALASIQGLVPPHNGKIACDLTLAIENIADHLTHFYMFFMPDFCRQEYATHAWHADVFSRFQAMKGKAVSPFLAARAEFMHMLGILAGKWPHTLSVQPGGSTRPVEPQEIVRLLVIVSAFRRYLERQVFGIGLERFAAVSSMEDLSEWALSGTSDLQRFWQISELLQLSGLGCATQMMMSNGSFGLFGAGVLRDGVRGEVRIETITEDSSATWLTQIGSPLHPFDGMTLPDPDRREGYTWCKAPRLNGAPVQVGAFARQVVDGHPLARILYHNEGSNVRTRIIGRFIEIARLIPAIEDWIMALRPREPFCVSGSIPDHADGAGFVEAARGSLGHWVRVRDGHIQNYQIISPTTWNFSPRDHLGTPGPLEQALVGTAVRGETGEPVTVQHVVRSFDPCMVCTVH